MTRYIDANDLLKEMDLYIERLQRMYKRRLRKGEVGVFLDLKAIAEGHPTVDVVPVIRCRDCKHQGKEYHEDNRRKDGGYYIYWCEKADGYSPLGGNNQYCSEAERKEE